MGVLDRENRDKDNETDLKEGGGIEMSTTVLPLRDARSLRLNTYRWASNAFKLIKRLNFLGTLEMPINHSGSPPLCRKRLRC